MAMGADDLFVDGWAIQTTTKEMKKIRSGFLLKDILNRFLSKLQSKLHPNRSLWMYFAHDYTILNMLKSLGIHVVIFIKKIIQIKCIKLKKKNFRLQDKMPTYASCLFFELYQGNNDPYVKLFYEKSPTERKISALEFPNCGTECHLKKLYKLYDGILPKKSIDGECALDDGETLPPGGEPENLFADH